MKKILSSLVLAAGLLTNSSVFANEVVTDYPQRPITIVIPFSSGGGTDQFMRIVTKRAAEILGQQFVIVNRPGASTVIGVNSVINAKPDGYTLLVSTNTSYTLVPYAISPPPYSPESSLDYVATLGGTEMVLTARLGVDNQLSKIIDKSKQVPGHYTYATYGVGSSTHLAGEVLMNDTDIVFRHIPYKGVEAVTALAGGQVDLMVDGANAAGTMINAGKTRAVVVLQHQRSEFLPNTPTLSEAGYPNATASVISYIMAAPKGTPSLIMKKLENAFSIAMKDPEVQEKIKGMRSTITFLNAEETRRFVSSQAAAFKEIVEKKNIRF